MSARRPHILIEDVDFMLSTGEHPWRIAQRLDMTSPRSVAPYNAPAATTSRAASSASG